MSDAKQNQPSTKVIVGQKIWASVFIAPGDVHPPKSRSKLSHVSRDIFDGKSPVKKQLIVLDITETHFVCAYTSTFGSSDKLDPKKIVNPNNWYPIYPGEGKYEPLAQPKGGDGLAGWVCLSQVIQVPLTETTVEPITVYYPEDSVNKIKGKLGL